VRERRSFMTLPPGWAWRPDSVTRKLAAVAGDFNYSKRFDMAVK
jgi:hypothetical protein